MSDYAGTAAASEAGAPRPKRTSELLREFSSSLTSERVSVEEIVSVLGDRGLGVLLAIFSLPNILPSTVPFGNVATGIPPLIFAFQLTRGVPMLKLPRAIARQTIGTKTLKAFAPRVASVLSWFERLLTPRLSWVTGPRAERVIGFLSMLIALVCSVPIPFSHQVPALGLVMIGLGLIERDGAAILAGVVLGVLWTLVLGLAVFGLVHGVGFLLHLHHHRAA